jgi:hypothetical protein
MMAREGRAEESAVAKCKYYEVYTKIIPDRKIRPDRQASIVRLKSPWCSHPKHSPVERWVVVRILGGGSLLKCRAQLDKCPLTEDQFNDE